MNTTFKLVGGLGNQMFIHAAGLYFAHSHKVDVEFIDGSQSLIGGNKTHQQSSLGFLSWGQNQSFPTRKSIPTVTFLDLMAGLQREGRAIGMRGGIFPPTYTSQVKGHDESLVLQVPGTYIRGYFQTPKYYDSLLEQNLISAPKVVNPSNSFIKARTEARRTRPIMIHLRRGDYTKHASNSLLSVDYYRSALRTLDAKGAGRECETWIFSDSRKEALDLSQGLGKNSRVVSENYSLTPAEDMLLMAEGSSIVLSNSTFSWWAAKLSKSAEHVLYPSPWFRRGHDFDQCFTNNWVGVESCWE